MTESLGKGSSDVVAEIIHRVVSQISKEDEAHLAEAALYRTTIPSGDPRRAASAS